MESQLHLELLGGARITRGGAPLHFVTAKAAALLCYLAVTGRPHSRTSLAALLWSEHAEDDARRNLRVVLTNLRHLVAPHLLITRETLAFDHTSAAWLDVDAFEAALRGAAPHDLARLGEAVGLYRGDFWKASTSAALPPSKNGRRRSASGCATASCMPCMRWSMPISSSTRMRRGSITAPSCSSSTLGARTRTAN